jgi:hypothetical protein
MELAEAGARMPKMAIRGFRITTPSRSATPLHTKIAWEETAGYLASIASQYQVPHLRMATQIRLRQPHCRTGASRLRTPDHSIEVSESSIRINCHCHAGAISGNDTLPFLR